jgi:hypothetical protein
MNSYFYLDTTVCYNVHVAPAITPGQYTIVYLQKFGPSLAKHSALFKARKKTIDTFSYVYKVLLFLTLNKCYFTYFHLSPTFVI